jgi:hypothetical protein
MYSPARAALKLPVINFGSTAAAGVFETVWLAVLDTVLLGVADTVREGVEDIVLDAVLEGV